MLGIATKDNDFREQCIKEKWLAWLYQLKLGQSNV